MATATRRYLAIANQTLAEAEELAGEGHGLWTARVNPKTLARVGRTVELAVDTGGVHFFDKRHRLAIGHPDPAAGNGRL